MLHVLAATAAEEGKKVIFAMLITGLVEALDPEREAHAPLGAELVDQQRMARLRVLEQQRRPAGLDDPVRDLGDLEVRIDLGGDANELTLALEERDPVAKIGRRSHNFSLWRDDLAQFETHPCIDLALPTFGAELQIQFVPDARRSSFLRRA